MMIIDDWLYTRVFDPIAHQAEARSGVTKFALSRYALIPYGAWALTYVLKPYSWDMAMIASFGIINVLLGLLNARMAESMAPGRGTANFHRVGGVWQICRGFWLGVASLEVFQIAWAQDLTRVPALCAALGYMAHIFFLGCSGMPPSLPREIAARRAARSGSLATVEG